MTNGFYSRLDETWGSGHRPNSSAGESEGNWRKERADAAEKGAAAEQEIVKARKRRGLASPDDGDALALTFAYPVAKRDWAEERRFEEGLKRLRRWIV